MKRWVLWLLPVMLLSFGCATAPPDPGPPIHMPAPMSPGDGGPTGEPNADALAAELPRNANGETYGSGLYAWGEPDLIRAEGVDGTIGYVRATDLRGPMPRNPAEALAQQRARAGKGRQIPLYAVDGKTVIGVFNIGP